MSIGIHYANTGLVRQNHTVINAVNKKVIGCTEKELKAVSTGTMKAVSAEELETIRKNKEQFTYICEMDRSAIMNAPGVGIKAVTSVANNSGSSNTVYNIDGVTFTAAELSASREVMKNAISMLTTKGSSLDYKDYASMGIASNMVSSYAQKNLTQEQAGVINQFMEEYLDSMVQAEKERYSGEKYFIDHTEDGDQGARNQYYNVRKIDDRRMYAELREMFLRELGPVVGAGWLARLDDTLARIDNGEVISHGVRSATNRNVTSKVKELFAGVDLYDEDALSETYKEYRKLMKAVYDTVASTNAGNGGNGIAQWLFEDVNAAASKISNAKAVIDNVGRKVNCGV